MPSPIGHTGIGLILYYVASRFIGPHNWPLVGIYLFAANAADLDFIPGFLAGYPNRYHHGISHSLGFSILFALVVGLLLLFFKREPLGRNVVIFFGLYFSHVALDYLSIDTTVPYGVPLFWPLSDHYVIAPFAFLPDIQRAVSGSEFIPSLFSLHNLWAAGMELLLLLPFLLLMLAIRRRVKLPKGDSHKGMLATKKRHGKFF